MMHTYILQILLGYALHIPSLGGSVSIDIIIVIVAGGKSCTNNF